MTGFSKGCDDDADSFPVFAGGSEIFGSVVETASFVADARDCRLEGIISGASLAAEGVDVPELPSEAPDTFCGFGDIILERQTRRYPRDVEGRPSASREYR